MEEPSRSSTKCECRLITQYNFGFRIGVRICDPCAVAVGYEPHTDKNGYYYLPVDHKKRVKL